ncbi:response regulator [Algoriphagus pacificus]|uniref:Response regulator n=1 Tax=Algoriphagus pacificus TaxID=2811234 RepID=A0ABS3CKY2_9BACT|nr:response regulator [Algoriphagus pacificus]MBN7817697.1 response regulator [Algoriphagus pacificus]
MKNDIMFITVDDDPVNNLLSKLVIKKAFPEAIVHSFLNAELALQFIEYEILNCEEITLFLDINMPEIDGWGFLCRFDKLNPEITSKINIYMLSSSLDENDVIRAKSYSSVLDYIVKPLSLEKMESVSLR